MNFLAKLAAGIVKGLAIVSGLQPLLPVQAQPVVGVVASELTLIAQVIAQVETFGQALGIPGPQKLIAAAPSVEQIILTSSLMVGKKIQDEAKFKQAVSGLASHMADLLSALHGDAVSTESKT